MKIKREQNVNKVAKKRPVSENLLKKISPSNDQNNSRFGNNSE